VIDEGAHLGTVSDLQNPKISQKISLEHYHFSPRSRMMMIAIMMWMPMMMIHEVVMMRW